MKRIVLIVLAAALASGSVIAQELKLSGEVKTGFLWEQGQNQGEKPDVNKVRLGSKDDAGGGQGRYRLNMDYDNGNGFGMRIRVNWEEWKEEVPKFSYAFGYGNFFENNLTVAIGKLGGSPWSTGGPEMWKELETAQGGGMRVEYKPGWVPEAYGKFNVGFVLNYFDGVMEAGDEDSLTLGDLLQETVLGFSWEHDLFLVRFAYRLDGPFDIRERGYEGIAEGGTMVYRLEERILKNYLPGLQIWALGYLQGIGGEIPDMYLYQNWLFAQYSPEMFTAQLRFGLDTISNRSLFYVKPSFYWNFFEKLISVGAMFGYTQDFGEGKIFPGSPYSKIELEPRIQINFSSSYIAFAYNWSRSYVAEYRADDVVKKGDPIRQDQWMNLRFCIYY